MPLGSIDISTGPGSERAGVFSGGLASPWGRWHLDSKREARQVPSMLEGYQFPKTTLIWFEAHPGTAGWAQAVIAGCAIFAVYLAATIPVRADAARRERERKIRATGLALLLVPEIVVLKGLVETCIEQGTIYDNPIELPANLAAKTDQLYILGDTGGRLLQAMGIVDGVAAQTRRFQAVGMFRGAPIIGRRADGDKIWQNNLASLGLALMNVDEAIKSLRDDAL
jgi:hypothetical protein